MRIPVFAEIVSNRTYVPNDGRPPRPGGDILVGRHGVIGGKTGYTDAAGGNFVFAARKRTGKVTTTIVGAVMGQRSPTAMGAITVAHSCVCAEHVDDAGKGGGAAPRPAARPCRSRRRVGRVGLRVSDHIGLRAMVIAPGPGTANLKLTAGR
jgi:hypothetical protein